jgi:non-canonical (house-cleaning) NTP pyrophosphatase
MQKQLIAVGSRRGPKLEAVHDALQQFAVLGPPFQFELIGFNVDSGVGHTPMSSAESMLGARQRADALIQMASEARQTYQFYVGLEGGLEVLETPPSTGRLEKEPRRVFLESWAYVTNGSRGYFGRSGAIELPHTLALLVLEQRIELAAAIDTFTGSAGVRDNQGAWGVLSCDLITRREAFRIALIAAFAPFYNTKFFHAARAAS